MFPEILSLVHSMIKNSTNEPRIVATTPNAVARKFINYWKMLPFFANKTPDFRFPILVVLTIVLLTACGTATPPREFAPGGEIVAKAIALQFSQTQQSLSQQLNISVPQFDLSQIEVKQIEPISIGNLPTYHLQGTYYLSLKLPRRQVTQKNNPFDIYLQRQAEGETWRLLKREFAAANSQPQWSSYLIPNS